MKEAYYFPHDANARTDARILELRAELGWEGYGLWWALVEHLREASEYRLSNTLIGGLAMDLAIPKPKLRTLLDLCISLGLLIAEDGFFFSPSLRRRMKALDDKRETRANASKQAADMRWQKQRNANAMPTHSKRIATAMQSDATVENTREQDKTEEGRKEESQPASQPSSLDDEKNLGAVNKSQLWPDQAVVFSIAGFKDYVTSMGFENIDRGFYLPDLQGRAVLTEKQRDETGWQNFVKECLKREKANGKLLLRDPDAKPVHVPAPFPADPRSLWGF